MLSETNRESLAFVIWCLREWEDTKMLFSIIELHYEINQSMGNLSSVSRAGQCLLLTQEHFHLFFFLPSMKITGSQSQHLTTWKLAAEKREHCRPGEGKANKALGIHLGESFLPGLFSEAATGGQSYLISVTFHVLISALPWPVITVFY